MTNHEPYMRRCIQLAELGAGTVAPNPMVGSVLVYDDTIVGEGYHRVYGQAHAEVNCIRDFETRFAAEEWKRFGFASTSDLLQKATLYVSLEPCAHFGKTPPCADMIVRLRIPRVVVGVRDPFPEVDGKGIDKLREAGIEVTSGVLEPECRELNKRFFTFHAQHRPYIILKWAQSVDGYIGRATGRVPISNRWSNLLVHRWRSEEASILVGRRTALIDDPALTNRHWAGRPNPLRLVLDPSLTLPSQLQLFDGSVPTIVFNTIAQESRPNELHFQRLSGPILEGMMSNLYHRHVQSVLVEGGAHLLESLIGEGLWDEIRVIRSGSVRLSEGVKAPDLPGARLVQAFDIQGDHVSIYRP